jgi:hypothetical protein
MSVSAVGVRIDADCVPQQMAASLLRVLRTRNLSILDQLRVEEALLRASSDNWLLINDGCSRPAIVLGISGKAEEHVDVPAALRAGVPLIRRFTGGGTVVVDRNTVFTTMIFARDALPHVKPFPREIMAFTGEVPLLLFSHSATFTPRPVSPLLCLQHACPSLSALSEVQSRCPTHRVSHHSLILCTQVLVCLAHVTL